MDTCIFTCKLYHISIMYPNEFSSAVKHNSRYSPALRLSAAVIAAGLLVAGCANIDSPPHNPQADTEEHMGAGFIWPHANLRTGPERIDDLSAGKTNRCTTLDKAMTFDATTVLVNPGDANGEYVGIKPQDLPELPAGLKQRCKGSRGMVWVWRKNIAATISDTP